MSTHSRAAVFHGPGQALELRELAIPELKIGEILVRITYCTLCGSDLHSFAGRRKVATPTILGHEMIGRIERFGGTTRSVEDGIPTQSVGTRDLLGNEPVVGNRVTWTIAASCGDCFYCRNDLPQKCEHLFKYGHEALTPPRPLAGGLADYCVLLKGTGIVKIPDNVPDAVACPANCATATAAAALRTLGDCRDRAILVQGAGMLGLTACAMANRAGARVIICCDPNAERAANAQRFGATHTVSAEAELREVVRKTTDGRGVDLALDASGAIASMELGLQLLRIGGRYVWVGAVFPTPPLAVHPETIIRRMLTISGVHNYRPNDLASAVAFLGNHHKQFPFAELVSTPCDLVDAERAFQVGESPRVFRSAVRMEST